MSPKGNDRFPLCFWLCALPFSRSVGPTIDRAAGYIMCCVRARASTQRTICSMYFRLICRDKLTFAIIDKIASMSENADDCLCGGGRCYQADPPTQRSGLLPRTWRQPSNNPINITCMFLPCYYVAAEYVVGVVQANHIPIDIVSLIRCGGSAWPPRRAHCATNFIKHAKSIARMATAVEEENIAAD